MEKIKDFFVGLFLRLVYSTASMPMWKLYLLVAGSVLVGLAFSQGLVSGLIVLALVAGLSVVFGKR